MTRTSFALVVLVAACSGGSSTSAKEPAPAPAPTPEQAQAGCQALFAKQRECTDQFIPALVGWRVELDVPAGVAEADKTEGRDALVAKAKAEWAASNSDEQLAELCRGILGSIPAEQLGPMMEVGERCTAAATCDEFVTCIEPAQRQRLQDQKAAAK